MKSRSIAIGVWLLLIIARVAEALDPSKQITQYGHTAWRTKDGFFSATPLSIAQTADGYMWIGTAAGLMRFDGVRFTPWTPPSGEPLPSSSISALYAARDGSFWIGTDAGICRWAGDRLITFRGGQGRINNIAEDRDGRIWFVRSRFLDEGALCQVVADAIECYGKAHGLYEDGLFPLTIDASGELWVGGDRRLLHGRPGHFREYVPPGLESHAHQAGVQGIVRTRDQRVWMGIALAGKGLGLRYEDGGAWKPFVTTELDGESLPVVVMAADRDDGVWVGTMDRGLVRVHGQTATRFRQADGLSGEDVYRIFEDREGTIWVITSGGVDSFRDLRVTSWSTREGLSSSEIDGVYAARDGTVWISCASALGSLRDGRITSIVTGKGLPGTQTTSIFEDRQGQLWVGIDNRLSIYEDGRFHFIDKPDGTPVGMVTSMTEDTDGNLWIEVIGPPRTLFRIRDRVVREAYPDPVLPAARQIAAAPDGGLWLGLMTGDLARWHEGRLDILKFRPPEVPAVRGLVRQILVDADGTVLAATSFGLLGWKQGVQRTLTMRNGLPCVQLYGIVNDREGDLWLYTPCGIVEVPHAELREWWTNADVVVHPMVLDIFDGAQGEFAPFTLATRSADGRLWFANGARVQMVQPTRLRTNPVPPPVHIEAVVADHTPYATRDGLSLPPRTRDLQINFTALSLAVPRKVRFRYTLEGHDADWIDPGTRRQAFYNDLRPGSYRFRVKASNEDGVWNETGAALRFRVLPAWYEAAWFRVATVLAVLGMIWALYEMRVRRVAATLGARFDERLKERTRLARDLHDTLLQTLQASKLMVDMELATVTDPGQMRLAATQVSAWLDQAMQEGRAALNSLRGHSTHACDLLNALREATEEVQSRGAMHATVRVIGDARDVHPIVGEEITAIGREAIRNAARHSGGSRLDVELRYDADLLLRVWDDGVGMDPSIARHGKHGHFGLRGMRERAAGIASTLRIASTPAGGTEITLIVPGGVVFSRRGDGTGDNADRPPL